MKLDVSNLAIRTAQREFTFHNGVAVNYDGYEDRSAGPPKPDWEAEIVGDKVIHPAPNVTVRCLVIRGQEVFDGKDECSMWHVPPQFLEPGWNAHKPEEIGIDDFQASRSPNMQCRTTPLRSFFVRMKDGLYYDGRCHTTLRM